MTEEHHFNFILTVLSQPEVASVEVHCNPSATSFYEAHGTFPTWKCAPNLIIFSSVVDPDPPGSETYFRIKIQTKRFRSRHGARSIF
jgi:hypothetical protein